MSRLPEGWIETSFMGVFGIKGGTQPPKAQFKYEPQEGYIRLLQIRDFGDRPVPTYIPNKSRLNTCNKEDVLIGRYGASVGKICTGMEGAYNVALAKVIAPKEIDRRFVFYLLQSNLFQKPILATERSAQDGFNKDDLERICIPLPPLAEQRRIAAKLEPLLGSIDTYQQRLVKIPVVLKRFRQAVLAAVLVEQSESVNIRDVLAAPLSNGRSVVTASNGFPVLRLTCLKNGLIDLSERKIGAWTKHEARNFLVAPGDYLVSRGNGSLSLVGRGGFVDQISDEVAYPDTLIRIRVNEDLVNTKYFGLIWNSSIMRSQIEGVARTSAGIWKISQRDIENFVMPLPPLSKQDEIVRRVETLFKLADQIEARYQKAKPMVDKLPQSILAKAFRGELVPTEAEIARREGRDYEPASVLLERVRSERAEHAQGRKEKAGSQMKPIKGEVSGVATSKS